MKTQDELRREIDRLLAADRLDEADTLINQLEPVSADEFKRRLDEAPLDDEPLTPAQRARVEQLRDELRELNVGRLAG